METLLPKFEKGVDYNWHFTEKFNRRVSEFHNNNALPPKPKLKLARKLHTDCIDRLQAKLKQLQPGLFSRLIYTGSAYEGVKVVKNKDDDDLEFDIMMLLNPGSNIEMKVTKDLPGFAEFHARNPEELTELFRRSTSADNHLCPEKVMQKFKKIISECIEGIEVDAVENHTRRMSNESEASTQEYVLEHADASLESTDDALICTDGYFRNMRKHTKIINHGPAIQLDVFYPKDDEKFYSVDIVPTIEFKTDSSLYVAKPLKGKLRPHSLKYTWRKSFSLEEKNKFYGVDKENSCRRQVFRILKAIRNKEAGLAKLSSYLIKTVLFREMDHVNEDKEWSIDNMGQRFIGVLRRLRDELSNSRIEHYFVPGFNLLDVSFSVHSATTIKQIENRLRHLINSQNQMNRILYTNARKNRTVRTSSSVKLLPSQGKTSIEARRTHR